MFIAPDGSHWYTGIRYFYDGKHHKSPPKTRGRGITHTIYHVFAPVNEDGSYRVFKLMPSDAKQVDDAELARRFATAGYATHAKFDPSTRDPQPNYGASRTE